MSGGSCCVRWCAQVVVVLLFISFGGGSDCCCFFGGKRARVKHVVFPSTKRTACRTLACATTVLDVGGLMQHSSLRHGRQCSSSLDIPPLTRSDQVSPSFLCFLDIWKQNTLRREFRVLDLGRRRSEGIRRASLRGQRNQKRCT